MNAEDRLAELMDAATRALNPPIEDILAEGERRGRVRRRRRRAALAGGTAAAVLLAAGGAVLAERAEHTPRGITVGAGGAAEAAGSAEARPGGPSPSPRSTVSPAGDAASVQTVPINAIAAANILRRLVGGAWKLGGFAASTPGSVLDVDIEDGLGPARIFVDVAPAAKSGMDPIDCTPQVGLLKGGGPRPVGALPPSCSVETFPNGDRAMVEVLAADTSGEYQYRIIVSRADGVAVEITAANGDWNNPKAAVTRARPPLTPAQWTAIALSAAWQVNVPVTLAKKLVP
jgi:hypothetical protein